MRSSKVVITTRSRSHLALDAEYRSRQRAKDEARAARDVASARRTRLIEGLADGFDSAVGGVVDGVTGLVQEPMRGAERAGAAGVFLGLGRGVLGLAVKPVCGLADAATDVLRGERAASFIFSEARGGPLDGPFDGLLGRSLGRSPITVTSAVGPWHGPFDGDLLIDPETVPWTGPLTGPVRPLVRVFYCPFARSPYLVASSGETGEVSF
jgi:hypothetical protein